MEGGGGAPPLIIFLDVDGCLNSNTQRTNVDFEGASAPLGVEHLECLRRRRRNNIEQSAEPHAVISYIVGASVE